MKVFLDSIGCRLNHSEMETLARQLLAAGHEIVTAADDADQVVLNTCAVTAEATREARQRARKYHRVNEAAEVILTGCYATIAPQEIDIINGVGRIVPNQQKDDLLFLIDPQAQLKRPVFEREPILRDFHQGPASHTRAFIKVQDGCDNKCTFCVTTVARGDGVSRHFGDVIAEIQGLAAAGYTEAVLSGVHLGSYGRDLGQEDGLKRLVEGVLHHTDIERLRLSSLEPWDIAPGFFDLWQNRRLLPHLHLPLQSGSDKILRRMARKTRRESFRALVADARAAIPDVNLTSDIIVGFPGESDDEFEQTLDFVGEIGFSRVHAFPYSVRPGTAAATMPDQLSKKVKKERIRRLITLSNELSSAFHGRYVGRSVPVLWEALLGADENGLRWSGYTNNYVRAIGYGPADALNKVTPLLVEASGEQGVSGKMLLGVKN